MDNNDIITRFLALETERRSNVEDDWNSTERFICPGRGKFFLEESTESELTWRRSEIYDSTALTAASALASALHSALTSVSTLWFDMRFRKEEHNKQNVMRRWLEDVRDRIWQELQDSNFAIQAAEMYMDLVCFGSSLMVAEEIINHGDTNTTTNFKTIPIRETFFEEGYDGGVYRIYRRLNITPVQIIDKFGEDNVPQVVKDRAATTQGSTARMKVIFCVWPRPGKQDADTRGLLGPLERPYGYKYVLAEGKATIGEEGGYYEMPGFLPRWAMMSGSRWGYSPAMQALPTVRTLNEYNRLVLKAAEKVIDPPSKVTERGLIGDVDLEPGGLTVLRDIDALQPYESKARFDVSAIEREHLVEEIRSIFMVRDLEMKESPQMTATEVMERVQHMQRRMAPVMARLQDDFLDPLISRVYKILFRAGKLPPPPPEFAEDAEIDIQYVSPLAKALKNDSVSSLITWSQQIAALAEVQPEVLDVPDWDAMVRELADALNIPAKLQKSSAQVKTARDERKELQASMAESADLEQKGKAMQALGDGATSVRESGAMPDQLPANVTALPGAGA